ncbi:MAG: bifunctional glutamate N-acetyltransferase/amino-acid acetyltransferase ArgJ [Myxococcota bacterium]|nr:bifunctional glutamate N-acetyltransferase/amino-acid acetyltransferase ArgJ [Myxococcota bacterium]
MTISMLEGAKAVPGFRFSGVHCGLKGEGQLDLGLIVAEKSSLLAARFTQNQVVAAPVQLSRAHGAGERCRAVVVNSGNANACTGPAGMAAAEATAQQVASQLSCPAYEIQVASTGVIGRPLDAEALLAGVPAAFSQLDDSNEGLMAFAQAIMTTDQGPKVQSATVGSYTVTVVGKGAGMIAPNLATMLAFAVTDAPLPKLLLADLWDRVVRKSFNAIVVDGDTSTNDTALLLCPDGGEALSENTLAELQRALLACCRSVAQQMVADGEGARCLVEIQVSGAATKDQADDAARAVATSLLCKTAFHGADPNWGRILAAAGRSRAQFDPDKARLHLTAEGESILLFEAGMPVAADWAHCSALMEKRRYGFVLDLNNGDKGRRLWTCDLGHNYVTLNSEYTT